MGSRGLAPLQGRSEEGAEPPSFFLMRILSIDTSADVGGAALVDSETGLVGEVVISVQRKKKTFSERLMPAIDSLLVSEGCQIGDVEAFALTVGPGSFTGLRVGLSTIKGLAFATGKPVLALPTFEALSYNYRYCSYPVCAILEAKKDEVYATVFQWHNNCLSTLVDPGLYNIDELLDGLTLGKIVFTGGAIIPYRDVICNQLGDNAILGQAHVSPLNVGLLALERLKAGEICRIEELSPIYLKKSQAEERYGCNHPPDDGR
ncbi:MAG: tRNA (adenosine(37)-N6)-threonylcarbamoyltransferase complex dimerization subunit type 1 TsaB [Nitrospirae bacterium]|nr:tRNA (adenosine(37)-N6)-threonylcarbamoyltransferase complex dimerization subunit type 1 TsaB [Nitrospirota bacterium]MBF0591969.1 tRNA (adenosine(37)-N6)-threonylcarbamoyltransferase complex dimerization subunit type 1 TsaB [Nitrospirota bacterium]